MKIALIGTGKMGSAVEQMAINQGHTVLYRINENSLNLLNPEYLSKADIAVEFTTPASAPENLKACLEAGIPVVCGTTGWQQHSQEITDQFLKKNGSLLISSNFSIGVNLLLELNRLLSGWMNRHPQYKVSLDEAHHIHKMDKPSGTAVTIAEDILKNNKQYSGWQISDNFNSLKDSIIPIEVFRVDDVIGNHTIIWESKIDKLTLRHEAFSREGFAAGVLEAINWLPGKQGVFGMKDLLFYS